MENTHMKLVCNLTLLGVTSLRVVTTATGNQGVHVKAIVGPGNPYWIWPTIPAGKVIGADFSNAPIATDSWQLNSLQIDAITTTPEEVLIYE